MRTEEWLKVEALLNSALELDPAGRRRLLDDACAGAPELRREVESLLACEEGADAFLAAPALVLSADFFDADDGGGEDRAGQTVGHYRIIREIGRGGMGAVYLAERADGEFTQRVALKVVRRSFADSELARRFRQERQILASLNHPNIARLLDGGVSADGEPYFAMEYVEGVRIDDYCDARKLSIRDRLRLFLEVCQGVAYAHQHLVVHRDLKPSNILVGTDAQTNRAAPKLLDFGIAKLLDEEGADEHTRTGLRAFTPDYASPEQVRGATVTTASDVYSLGVLLQDLMAGAHSRPNSALAPGRWRSETPGAKTAATNLPTNQEGRDAKPPTVGERLMGAELRNIVAMARRDEPQRRYASVTQLAEDVQRYLDGRPVRAQKDTFAYRAGKFVRRNKVTVAAALIVAASLVAGLAAALWQANVARRERDRAERRFSDVRQLSNALLTDIAPKIERLPGSTEARQSLVTQSLKYLDSLAKEAGDDPALQSELASAYERVGDLQGNPTNPNVGDLSAAIMSYEKARAIRQKLLEANPNDPAQRRLLAANYQTLGDTRWQAHDLKASHEDSETALLLYEKLVAEQPGSTELRLALAQINLDIGQLHSGSQKFTDSFPYLRKAMALSEELRQGDPRHPEILKLLGNCHSQLGNALSWDGQQKEGEAEMAKAVAIYEPLVENNPNDVSLRLGLWLVYLLTSSVYEEQNDALSHEYALKALKTIREVVEKDGANQRARQQLAKSYSRLGTTSTNTGRPAEAIAYLEQAIGELRELARGEAKNSKFKYNLAVAYHGLALARRKQRDAQAALADFEAAAAAFGELAQTDGKDGGSLQPLALSHEGIAEIHEELARAAAGEKRRAHARQAKAHYQRALEALLQLEADNVLSAYDRKSLEKMKAAVQRYERAE